MINIPQPVQYILNTLQKHGFEAYVVGGCVRDSLLGMQPVDWDIATAATPEETMKCFAGNRIIKTGLKHGTTSLVLNHKPYEITTFRLDGTYSDNRRPDQVLFIRSLRDDLARRDFTINAMAYAPQTGLVDHFGGLTDLRAKILHCVGPADARFREDGLRILRGLRFAALLGLTIEENTARDIHLYKDLLLNIAPERLRVELVKLLCGRDVEQVLMSFADVLAVVIPEIKPMFGFRQHNAYHCYDVWQHTMRSIAEIPGQEILRLTMFLHDIGKPDCFTMGQDGVGHFYGHNKRSYTLGEVILSRFKFDNETKKQVLRLVLYHDITITPKTKLIKRWLRKLGELTFRQLLLVKKADTLAQHPDKMLKKLEELAQVEEKMMEIIEQGQCFCLKDLAIDGRDVQNALGIKKGKEVGVLLEHLLNMVINEELENRREVLLEALVKHRQGMKR